MRAQVPGTGGTIIADIGDYGAAVDLGIRHDRGWMAVRLTLKAARKLAEALTAMANRCAEAPPRARKRVTIASDGSKAILSSSGLERGAKGPLRAKNRGSA